MKLVIGHSWVRRLDALFVLKGRKAFSDPSLYARDGVHLNYEGNVKLADRLNNF